MAKAMVSRSISNHSVILVRVAAGGVAKAVAVEAKAVVRAAGAAAKVEAVEDKAVVVAVVQVRVDPAETNKDVLESGTSAVRGSQARMAGLPRLTKLQGLYLNQMPQPAS
jgi:hypothetical protein